MSLSLISKPFVAQGLAITFATCRTNFRHATHQLLPYQCIVIKQTFYLSNIFYN